MKIEMTPGRRIDVAFWLGTIQAILSMTLFQNWQSDDPFSALVSMVLLAIWLAIGIVYIRNTIAFGKETLWMTIKNPAKVTMEQNIRPKPKGMGMNAPGTMPPVSRPKPPPPPGRNIKEGEQPNKADYGIAKNKTLDVPKPADISNWDSLNDNS